MAVLSTLISIYLNLALKNLEKWSLEIWRDRWNPSETGRRTFLFVPQVNINRASFNSRTNRFMTEHEPFMTYLHRFGLCSRDRCVCGAKGDPNYYATVCPVANPFHFTKPSAENLSMLCKNIVQDKRFLAWLMSFMKIIHEGMISSWIKKDFSPFHAQL
ncbi:hypothetical protein AVEN_204507-1 [Araneus ventricosus]|uniref:Uncharacterized protein n=1 Tax=Araneus ventricosus TaxID=182803 RepID=A0A4Y2PXK9_ARAVE|nr:hypothetical protein AVEN_81777-1 [Araneus ventricosus]GBN56657.1 hypothetical protein AVEN_204507-1 [Araneus ventricosus]